MSVTVNTEASTETISQPISYIWYLIQFQNNKVQVLINSGSEINIMTLVYAAELSFTTRITSIGAQKIDSLLLETYSMILARFSTQDSLEKVSFFEDTFLLADTSIEVVLKILFLVFNNTDFRFCTEKFN